MGVDRNTLEGELFDCFKRRSDIDIHNGIDIWMMKVGITFSTFDLLHAGHVAMLREAKSQCDYLIVGLQSDPTIDRPDTKNKPVQTMFERYLQLTALKYVDEVVVQKDRDKLNALHKIGFNIMFVGDDWKGSKIFLELERKFQKYGVEIFYFPYTKNISSTSLRSTLKRLILEEEKDSN